jgi:outer membrane protein TolC
MIVRRPLPWAAWLVVLSTLSVAPAAAQGPVSLTLEDAIARGLDRDPRMAETRARAEAARAAIAGRAALARPAIAAISGILRTNHVPEFGIPQADGSFRVIFPDIPTNYRARAELTVPLYTSGRVRALVSSAQADERAVVAEAHAAEADVALEVSVAYWTLAMARERVAVLTRSRDRADAVLADVGARVDAGLLPPNDRLSAEAQRARQQLLLIQAEQDASLAGAQLARLLGLAPGTSILTATPVDRAATGAADLAAQPAAELAARAAASRPERLALSERQAALRAAGDAVMAATRPQVAAIAAVEPARPNARFVPRTDQWHTAWDLGVQVSWSLWDGGRARAERAAALAQSDAVGARLVDLDRGVAVEVYQRQLDIATARSAITVAGQGVAAATEARRVVGERFAVGVASSTDMLDAEVAQLEAELERTRWQAALRIGEARLARSVGAR